MSAIDTHQEFIYSLHKQYGPLVQIAPNQISVNNAEGVREIFAPNKKLDRPEPLAIFNLNGSENLTATQNGDLHQERRKPIRSVYTSRAVEGQHMQQIFTSHLPTLVDFIDTNIGAQPSIDVIYLSRLFAADIVSNIIYGPENAVNVLGDQNQREAFKHDLVWSDERLFSISTLLILWYPSKYPHMIDPFNL
jgi:hypothetical protein